MGAEARDLFYPMLGMFVWTFLVMLRNAQVRIRAVMTGELKNEYFEIFRGAEPSGVLVQTGNHLRNLSESPPLFYAVSLAVIAMSRTDAVFVVLAWSYVALRLGHGLVHLTFNSVPLRFVLFLLSSVVLAIMWVRLGLVV